MESDPNILAIARAAIAEYGREAASLMRARAEEHLRAKETASADLWKRVADAVVEILKNRLS